MHMQPRRGHARVRELLQAEYGVRATAVADAGLAGGDHAAAARDCALYGAKEDDARTSSGDGAGGLKNKHS